MGGFSITLRDDVRAYLVETAEKGIAWLRTGRVAPSIAQLDEAHVFKGAIVTRIESGRAFYPAEAYHQDFLALNPTYPYIVYNDLPKLRRLREQFPALYRQ